MKSELNNKINIKNKCYGNGSITQYIGNNNEKYFKNVKYCGMYYILYIYILC